MRDIDLTVFTDEYLQKSYQLLTLVSGAVVVNNTPTAAQMQPLDITGRTLDITIRDVNSATFTDIVGSTGAGSIVVDDAVNGLWHYNMANSLWTPDLPKRNLVYSLRLITSGVPRRLWGGKFTVMAA